MFTILIADDDYIESGEFLNVEDCLDRTIACWYIEIDDVVEDSCEETWEECWDDKNEMTTGGEDL